MSKSISSHIESATHSGKSVLNSCAKKILVIILFLSVLAMGVASYLTYLHYEPTAAEFCNFNDQFNCDVVNKSIYSYIDLGFIQIPVSILGLGYYVFNIVMVVMVLKGFNFQKLHKGLSVMNVQKILTGLSVFGVVFSLYLTYIEAFVLFTYCVFCLASQTLVFLIMVLNFILLKKLKKA